MVLTGPAVNGEALLAIGLNTVLATITTYTVLLAAETFGKARRDNTAAYLVDTFVDDEADDEDPFDADEDFGESWSLWRPDARGQTHDCLTAVVPEVFAALPQADTGCGLDYQPVPFVHVTDRLTLELAVLARGFHVRHCPQLAELYQDPPGDWRALITRFDGY